MCPDIAKFIPSCALISALILNSFAQAFEPDNSGLIDYSDEKSRTLTQRQLITEVISRNAQVIFSELQVSIASDEIDRQRAAYQPFWFAEARYTDQKTENTAADRLSSAQRLNQRVFLEKRTDFETGFQLPVKLTGADITLSWSANRRDNNLIPLLPDLQAGEDVEYTAGLNLVVRQPLLRGLAGRNLKWQIEEAELARMVSIEQFRQRLLQTSSEALSAYWNLYRLNRFLEIRRLALMNAENIKKETNELVRVGRQPQIAMLEAEANIIDRKSELHAAEQAWLDAHADIKTLLNYSKNDVGQLRFLPVDQPEVNSYPAPADFDAYLESLLDRWPGYRIAVKNKEVEKIRLRGAREERRPQVDLVMGYGTSVLSYDESDIYGEAFSNDYPTWFIGLDVKAPLGRNIRGRADERTAQTRLSQADADIHFVKVSLANELWSRTRQLQQSHRDLELKSSNRILYEQLYEAELQRFNRGQVRLRDLYERESDRIRADQRFVDALVRYQLAIVALQLAEGSLFEVYDIAISSETRK